jgi:pimeloyl-ACP methyl ester carboxylesterase
VDNEQIEFRGVDGVVTRGSVTGDAGAPTVFLLHGGGQTRRSWRGTAARLARSGYRAVSIDMRGHGTSDWSPRRAYGLSYFAEDVRVACASVDEPAILVGASLGGLAALAAAGEDPPVACRALVLVDVGPRTRFEGRARIHRFMTGAPDGFASIEDAADAIAAYLPHRERPSNLDGLRHNLRLGDDGRWRWHWDPEFMASGDISSDSDDTSRLERAARAITAPILLMRGSESDVITAEDAAMMGALAPDCEVVTVEGARHMVAGDENDQFTVALVDFLGRRAPARSATASP